MASRSRPRQTGDHEDRRIFPPEVTVIKAPDIETALTLLCQQTGYVWARYPDRSVVVEEKISHERRRT